MYDAMIEGMLQFIFRAYIDYYQIIDLFSAQANVFTLFCSNDNL